MRTLEIRRPDDFHVHLRFGKMLSLVLPYTSDVFARAVVMPNLTEDGMVLNAEHVGLYQQLIVETANNSDFTPIMTIRLTPETTPEIIQRAAAIGVVVVKLYPDGVTTGSEGGVRDFKAIYPVLSVMQDLDMVLSIHGELPGALPSIAEQRFLPVLIDFMKNFPRLRIVFEHISSRDLVEFIKWQSADLLVGTITPQHLWLISDDVYGQPHNYCKPVAKTLDDRVALIKAATSGDPRFFHGSDSAPHGNHLKESGRARPGVFSAPVAMPLLAQVFDAAGALDKLEDFTSRFGAEFYHLPLNQGTIVLEEKSWQVPAIIVGGDSPLVVPFLYGQTLKWQIRKP